jgi:imidazolonepropionase-like amidohydrolase
MKSSNNLARIITTATLACGLLAAAIPASAMAADVPAEVTLFKDVNVFDGKSDKLLMGYDVLVVENLIKKVAKDIPTSGTYELDVKTGGLKPMETPHTAEFGTANVVMIYEPEQTVTKQVKVNVIDGGGRTLMPGMIEGHGHVTYASPLPDMMLNQDISEQAIRSARRAQQYLMAGFTTVRDMGGSSYGLQRALDDNVLPGPRIYSSGPAIGQTTGHGDFRTANDGHPYFDGRESAGVAERLGWTKIADGPDEVRRAVRDNLFRGAAQIKLMAGGGVTSFTDPLFSAAYSAAELAAGVEEAKRYGTYVAVHAQTNAGVVAALDAGAISIEHGLILEEETVKRMAKIGAYYNPQAFLALQDVSKNPMFQDPIQQEKNRQVAQGAPQAIEWAKKYGVKILWGTDVFFGDDAFVNFRQEFAYREPFFTPIEQMRQVTGNNGEVLALSGWKNPYPHGDLGVIKEGAYADLLLINGDPSKDIKILMDSNNIDFIMKDGKIYKNTL